MADNKKIFLSFNSKDRDEVSQIYENLKAKGFQPWLDKADLEPGQRWRKALEHEIEASDVFVAFVGADGFGPWQDKEWEYAVYLNESDGRPEKVFTVVLMSAKGTADLPGLTKLYHTLDLSDDPYNAMDELVAAIQGKTPDNPVQQPQPELSQTSPLDCYLQQLWRECINLKTTNFEYAIRRKAESLSLPSVYTPLDVIEPQHAKAEREADGEVAEGEPRQPLMQAVCDHPMLVLTGDPGSGKSTVVDFLTVCLAGQLLAHADINTGLLGVDDFPSLLPIRVILRHFAPHGLARKKDLWTYIGEHCAQVPLGNDDYRDCTAVLEHALNRKDGCVLLLDGIDEVPDARGWRLRLKQCIAEFRNRFPRCRILVTSRPYAYQTSDEKCTDFQERRVAPFTLAQMQQFVGQWYAELGLKQARLGPERAGIFAERLQNALEHNERLSELAQNPLLMSLMAWLHRLGEGGQLPEKRQRLYELCVEHLIDVWQMDKPVYDDLGEQTGVQFDMQRELGIGKDDLRRALEKLAYDAHRKQPSLVGAHDISIDAITRILLDIGKETETVLDNSKIQRFITNRAGILIEADQKTVFRFPHRTFQEYLAACHLTGHEFPHCFRERLLEDDERWREALLLGAAYVEKGNNIWNLVEVFCNDEGHSKREAAQGSRWTLIVRAAQAVTETAKQKNVGRYQQAVFEKLKQRLVDLLQSPQALSDKPQSRAEAGRALGVLGDPRIGVGVIKRSDGTDLPQHAWVAIPGTRAMGLENGLKLGQGAKSDSLAVDNEAWPDSESGVDILAFYMAAYPVTYAQFACFVDAGDQGYLDDQYWTQAGLENRGERQSAECWGDPLWHMANHPVVGVNWFEAVAYCRWLTARWENLLGENTWVVRLPTEAEWEWAARGPDARCWPWGDDWISEACNTVERGLDRTIAVGSDQLNRNWVTTATAMQGLSALPDPLTTKVVTTSVSDLAGNVWEWCASRWVVSYAIESVYGEQWHEDYLEDEGPRVLRGGAFWNGETRVRGAARDGGYPGDWNSIGGFRCCASTFSKETSES